MSNNSKRTSRPSRKKRTLSQIGDGAECQEPACRCARTTRLGVDDGDVQGKMTLAAFLDNWTHYEHDPDLGRPTLAVYCFECYAKLNPFGTDD